MSQPRENWQHNCRVIDPTSSSKEANVPLLKQDEDVCCRNIITKNLLNKVKNNILLIDAWHLNPTHISNYNHWIPPSNHQPTNYETDHLKRLIRDRRMYHRQVPWSRIEMMKLMHRHHLKPSSQIERKTWSDNQIPEHAIDQNSAKWIGKKNLTNRELIKVVKLKPTDCLLAYLWNALLGYLLMTSSRNLQND